MTIGVALIGSGTTRQAMPRIPRTRASVTIASGGPSAQIRPSRIAIT
jgi:hypothetical protein